jgi:SPX domain protein involved in polyphosphate accumulation
VTLKQKKKKKKNQWRNEDVDTNKSPYDFLKKKELEV